MEVLRFRVVQVHSPALPVRLVKAVLAAHQITCQAPVLLAVAVAEPVL